MQKFTRSLLLTGALALGGLVGCGDDVSVVQPPPTPDAVTAISISPPSASLTVGGSATFSASVSTTGAAAKTATFASSNAAVATVNATTGVVTGVAPGTTTITATATADAAQKASAQVTVTRGVTSVVVAPSNVVLAPGQTQQAGVAVLADPGVARTVTWSTSAAGVATVSTAGLVTAVAPGAAIITATSTVDASITGTMAVTVRAPTPASISIKSVTGGALNTPVNFNNVAGQIDVTVNVDPGDTPLARVELLLDNVVVATQTFSPAELEALRLAAVYPELEAAEVVFSINTAEFAIATGVVKYFNGVRQLSARAVPVGSTGGGTASTNLALTFNNQSGFVASVTNVNSNVAPALTVFPNSAVNPTTGQAWTQGTHTLTLLGVNYVQGQTYTNLAGAFLGKALAAAAPTSGQTYTFTFSGTSATGLGIMGYQSAAAGEVPVVTAAALSNGQAGSTTILNWDDPLTLQNEAQNRGLAPLPLARVDNVAPAAGTGTFLPLWLNASYSFMPTAQFTAGADAGVAGVTTKFYYILAATGLPATCTTAGMTEITTGSQLAETLVSTEYLARAISRDGLGNPVCTTVSNPSFGADFVTPNITAVTGPANNSAFNVVPVTPITFTVTDNASGFGASPVRIRSTRVNSTGADTCVWGSGTGCVNFAFTTLGPIDPTNGTNGEGYYSQRTTVEDQAANRTAENLTTFLVDVTLPTFSGGISLPSVIAGATTNTFNVAVGDNLDLASISGVVAYPSGANLQYQTQTLGSYGVPLEKSANVAYAASDWIRCLNAAGDFSTTTNQPTTITFALSDQAANSATLASGPFGANAQACGTVGNIAVADIITVTHNLPNYGVGKTQVDIDGASMVAASTASVTLSAVAEVALNTSLDPFTRLDFYYQNTAGNWVRIGQAAAALSQTPTQRFWTYTLTWDPGAAVPLGVVAVMAIGVDAQGDAVQTAPQGINTVP
jgi:hypothetical protein